MRLFGLIGHPLSHSFSKSFFTEKFKKEKIADCRYENFDLEKIEHFKSLSEKHKDLCGLNVTIPYKTAIIPYMKQLDAVAAETKAVNTVLFKNGITIGFNTDVIGFRETIKDYLSYNNPRALILGTGGSAKAVAYVLKQAGVTFQMVSRKTDAHTLTYSHLTKEIIESHTLIINCTPLGRHPEIDQAPPIPYNYLTDKHFLYDLNYNPSETVFMKEGLKRGVNVKNGMEMLIKQAEASWHIWNNESEK